MLTSEVLNRAADLIEERGWVQGNGGFDGSAGLCLEGGIFAASGLGWTVAAEMAAREGTCPAYEAVLNHLSIGGDRSYGGRLWLWNDKPARTAAEVIEVLRAAAAIEQARESEPSVVQS